MQITTMEMAMRIVQEHLAGPLGATARLLRAVDPQDTICFEYGGRTVTVWFDRQIVVDEQPAWVRITVGSQLRVYQTVIGYQLVEVGSQGRTSSMLPIQSCDELVDILGAVCRQLQMLPWKRESRAPLPTTVSDAREIVQVELAGPLGVTAYISSNHETIVFFQCDVGQVLVEFSTRLAEGRPSTWVRISIDWQQYMYATTDGYAIASQRAPHDIHHYLRDQGDLLEALRGARAAFALKYFLYEEPLPVLSAAIVGAVRAHFVAPLGIRAEVETQTLSVRSPAVFVMEDGETQYLLSFDPAFLEDEDQGEWVMIVLDPDEGEGKYLCEPPTGLRIVDANRNGHDLTGYRLPVAGFAGLAERLEEWAAYITAWRQERANWVRPVLRVLRNSGER
ncbi:MAG: hypothetical protein K0R39_2487 [Symbiobacteriaceae bacterium]|jgi:hypothetical protein|nr:hypothetical protein [Symbiobacteriaceae bacterium]